MQSGTGSDVGRRRPRNEDALLADDERRLFVVADGMGGHPAGDVASQEAIAAVNAALEADVLRGRDVMPALTSALVSAHRAVVESAHHDPDKRGMGTTAVVAHVAEDESLLTCAHIGDSRAYVLTGDRLVRVTEDHVWGGEGSHRLSQAIGTSTRVEPEAAEVDLSPGDRVLLCTDGLTDMLDDATIAEHLGRGVPPQAVCDGLIATALDRGGVDNITCIVLEVDHDGNTTRGGS